MMVNSETISTKSLEEFMAKRHIEEIRTKKFSIGAKEPNPLTYDLHRAVTSLSAELYTKDVHFLMELIQNAEDNEYEEEVEPTLEFVLTKRDITGSRAPATLLVFNNEVGFSKKNMVSLCSVGRSTKKGKRDEGFIGEKGIGFKSVFLVSKEPHIISNGYKVKFSEEKDKSSGIGYIVPEWVQDKSLISNIQGVYGSNIIIPMTTIVLPLKTEKVESVKEQLSELHPELLLFLCKIKKLNVRISKSYYKDASDICAISISHETQHMVIRSKRADSRVVHLACSNSNREKGCRYYIWRQSFLVKNENKVPARDDVKEWVVSLAFPIDERLTRESSSSVGIFAYLPTSMISNFPFIVQADFLLTSSRESILLDNKWNLGILKCVPLAFANAFTSCVKENSSLFSVAEAFKFLPVEQSPISVLDEVRENIRLILCDAKIMPCESFDNCSNFCKPIFALRILSNFRQLLFRMKENGVSLDGITSLRNHPVDTALDVEQFDRTLDFLCVLSASESYGWYEKCISTCHLIQQGSETDYMEMLSIFANNEEVFSKSFFLRNDVFKYIDQRGLMQLCNACKTKKQGHRIWFAMEPELHVWLNTCNLEFNCLDNVFFLPNSTQATLVAHEQCSLLIGWLSSHANIERCSAYSYSSSLCEYMLDQSDENLLLKQAHFLYHSRLKGFLSETDLSCLVSSVPVIDGSNTIRRGKFTRLVCMAGSKWAMLFGTRNPFSEHGYHDLGPVYSSSGYFAGEHTPEIALLSFMEKHTGASDLPKLFPPNTALPVASPRLTSEQAFLLLDWIKYLRTQKTPPPPKFIASVRNGSWMNTKLGFNAPSKCVLPNEIGKIIFEMTSCVLNDLSILDETFYENKINLYSDELRYLGVTIGMDDVQKVAMDHFKAVSTSEMSKDCAISLLTFIGLLKERNMLDNGWLGAMSKGRWLRTSQGNCSPNKSVLHSEAESEAVSRVTSLPLIDRSLYGSKLDSFSTELALLGVKSDEEVFNLAPQKIIFPTDFTSLTSNCGFFLFKCIRHLKSDSIDLIKKLQIQPWLKTNKGFCSPATTILQNPDFNCLLSIVDVPVVDEMYYGSSIRSYSTELKALGVALDFNSTLKIVANQIHKLLSASQLFPSNVISLLQSVRNMLSTTASNLHHVCEVLSQEALFKTRCGFKKPNESILLSESWASISEFIDDLPTIDDSYYGIEIYSYQYELEVLGVIVGLEEGAQFIVNGLTRPIKADQMTAKGAITLLRILRILMSQTFEKKLSLASFLENIMESEFLRTSQGDRPPRQCVLFKAQWVGTLQMTDFPFLDDIYYGNCISEYYNELKSIGVKTDAIEICSLIFESLSSLTKTSSVNRYYKFLIKYSSDPNFTFNGESQVWIPSPSSSDEGQWVSSELCIVRDRGKLFANVFHCLDMHYEEEMLPIFSQAFGVPELPGINHCVQLWHSWLKRENCSITSAECHSFWSYVFENWNSQTEETLKQNITYLPAISSSFSGIRILSKEKLIYPDDFLLKNMFMNTPDGPLFVWLPSGNISLTITPSKFQLLYRSLGVKCLSDSVEYHIKASSVINQQSCRDLKDALISRGLLMIILAYFSGPNVSLDVKLRHEAAALLINSSVYESNGPIIVQYNLYSPEGNSVKVESRKVVHWDKAACTFLVDKSSYESRKLSMEFGSCFAQEIAEGVLGQERSGAVNDLRLLIHLGLDYEFEVSSVEYLLTRENLELFLEDVKFLSAFNDKLRAEDSSKRICPTTPVPSSKKQKQ